MLRCFATNLSPVCVNGVYSLIHIILMFFVRSGNHKFYIQFLRLLGLQSFTITLYNTVRSAIIMFTIHDLFGAELAMTI
jgi:hypothetical protein